MKIEYTQDAASRFKNSIRPATTTIEIMKSCVGEHGSVGVGRRDVFPTFVLIFDMESGWSKFIRVYLSRCQVRTRAHTHTTTNQIAEMVEGRWDCQAAMLAMCTSQQAERKTYQVATAARSSSLSSICAQPRPLAKVLVELRRARNRSEGVCAPRPSRDRPE